MKILYVSPDYYFTLNNSKLVKKLFPYLSQNDDLSVLVTVPDETRIESLDYEDNCTYHVYSEHSDFLDKKNSNSFSYIIRKRLSNTRLTKRIQSFHYFRMISRLDAVNRYDLLLTSLHPQRGVLAVSLLPTRAKKVLYLMDPPKWFYSSNSDKSLRVLRSKILFNYFLNRNDVIMTTPFIHKALNEFGYSKYDKKIIEVGFPMLNKNSLIPTNNDINMNPEKINLLFCGWLYSAIRSPKYFLDIISRLDERFCVYFMGQECDKLHERFDIQTKAQIVTLPQQSYQTALNAIHDADILINIGNSIPVHMPSKTLEYINTGKPIVNFHKMPDCTTLYYTNRYPLCLNLPEYDPDVDGAADAFVKFCTENKGRTINTSGLAEEFRDCTPEYILLNKYYNLSENNHVSEYSHPCI